MCVTTRINGFGCIAGGNPARSAGHRIIHHHVEPAGKDCMKERGVMTRTASELAQFLGCTVEGEVSGAISGVAAPASARASDLIYVETSKHLEHAAASAA